MSSENPTPPPRAQKNTDEELLAAVRVQCETLDLPVAPTEAIADHPDIAITQTTVKRRLDSLREERRVNGLQVGQGWVWWIPDDEDIRGTVDTSIISESGVDWARIDPDDAPDEFVDTLVESHPRAQSTTIWDRIQNGAGDIGVVSLLVFGLGLVLTIADNVGLLSIDVGSSLEAVRLLSVVGGLVFLMSAIVFALLAEFGDWANTKLAERDVWERTIRILHSGVEFLESRLSSYLSD